jgi:hypothetical protein
MYESAARRPVFGRVIKRRLIAKFLKKRTRRMQMYFLLYIFKFDETSKYQMSYFRRFVAFSQPAKNVRLDSI